MLKHLPAKRQTLFFSATMPAPIQALSRELLHNPATINLERKSAPAVGHPQAVYPVREELKPALFVELLRRGDIGSVIVFTRTKHRANRLADYLAKRGRSRTRRSTATAPRRSAPRRWRASSPGAIRCLVATDIVARGIDVEQLEHVVNFDVPHVPEDYIHRVGRTARADATGDAFTFVSPEEEQDLAAIERAIGKRLPRVIVPDFDYASKPKQRFEVPIAERIAEIRARKAEERKRAKEKAGEEGRQRGRAASGAKRPAASDAARRNGGAGEAVVGRDPRGPTASPVSPTRRRTGWKRRHGRERRRTATRRRMRAPIGRHGSALCGLARDDVLHQISHNLLKTAVAYALDHKSNRVVARPADLPDLALGETKTARHPMRCRAVRVERVDYCGGSVRPVLGVDRADDPVRDERCPAAEGWTPSREISVPKVAVGLARLGKAGSLPTARWR